MSTVFEFPRGIYPLRDQPGYCEVLHTTQQLASSRAGAIQRVLRGPGSYWEQVFTVRTSGSKEKELEEMLTRLQGGLYTARCPDLIHMAENAYAYNLSATFDDTGTFDDAGEFTSPPITLKYPSVTGLRDVWLQAPVGTAGLALGQRVQIGKSLHKIMETVTFDANGEALVNIFPALRVDMPANELVITDYPQGLWICQAGLPEWIEAGVRQRTLTMREDLLAITN